MLLFSIISWLGIIYTPKILKKKLGTNYSIKKLIVIYFISLIISFSISAFLIKDIFIIGQYSFYFIGVCSVILSLISKYVF